MKNIYILFVGVVVGAIIGGGAVALAMGRELDRLRRVGITDFSPEYELGRMAAFSHLIVAVYWRHGQSDKMAHYLDDEMLPAGLLFLQKHRGPDNSAAYYAWRLKMYYGENGLPIPAEVKDILEACPNERPRYYGNIDE